MYFPGFCYVPGSLYLQVDTVMTCCYPDLDTLIGLREKYFKCCGWHSGKQKNFFTSWFLVQIRTNVTPVFPYTHWKVCNAFLILPGMQQICICSAGRLRSVLELSDHTGDQMLPLRGWKLLCCPICFTWEWRSKHSPCQSIRGK